MPNPVSPLFQKLKHGLRSPTASAVLLAHAVFVFVLGLHLSTSLLPLELAAYDFLLTLHTAKLPADPRLTIVWCDDEDQRHWGWPLSDEVLVDVFEKIEEHEPAVIGLDLYRDLPVPKEGSTGYERLLSIFRNNENIYAIMKFRDEQGIRVDPPKVLAEAGRAGFNDVLVDSDGIIRRGLLFMDDGEQFYEYFGLKIVLYYLARDNITLRNDAAGNLILGETPLPPPVDSDFGGYVAAETGGYQFMQHFPGAPAGFDEISLTELMRGDFKPELLHGKIVLIGTNAEATPDFFYTPLGGTNYRMPGVAMHAYAISQLLRLGKGEFTPLRAWNNTYEILWLWLWCLSAAFACIWARSVGRLFMLAVIGACLIFLTAYYAFAAGYWVLLAAPGFAWITALGSIMIYLSYLERSQRGELMQLFSKHVSKQVADVIWASREQYLKDGRLLPQRLTATVLFTDLQNFTTLSERTEPQALMTWLNEYMESMVKIVEQHDGQVNKFIGDAVMAVFGIPIARESEEEIRRDALNAVNCALAMRVEMQRLNERWKDRRMPIIRMRAGIFTGPLVAGSLGSVERQEYTVLGDTVNTASRLESFDKELDAEDLCRILISDFTLNYISEQRFEIEKVGRVNLKGKSEPVSVYRVMGRITQTVENSNVIVKEN